MAKWETTLRLFQNCRKYHAKKERIFSIGRSKGLFVNYEFFIEENFAANINYVFSFFCACVILDILFRAPV